MTKFANLMKTLLRINKQIKYARLEEQIAHNRTILISHHLAAITHDRATMQQALQMKQLYAAVKEINRKLKRG